MHPWLVGLFPPLFLYAHNARHLAAWQIVEPVAVISAASLVAWFLLGLVVRSWHKAALLVSLFLALFFSFAHLNGLTNQWATDLSGYWVFRTVVIPPGQFLAAEAVVFLGVSALILTRLRAPWTLSRHLNRFALVLVCLPVAGVLLPERQGEAKTTAKPFDQAVQEFRESVPCRLKPEAARHLPDIYYIILDGYARSDVMRETFGYDNGPFLEHLEQRGFFVSRKSRANYCQTPLCLASSLNFRYLDALSQSEWQGQDEVGPLIGNNAVKQALRPLGYRFVTFATGFDPTDHPEADVYLTPQPGYTEFQLMLISTTPLAGSLLRPNPLNAYQLSRERTLYTLDRLPEVARMAGPTFTFAHIVCPHPPFVFGAEGEDVSPYHKLYRLTDGNAFREFYGDREEYRRGYHDQAKFLTGRIQTTIDRILAASPEPPIIILQSDHGSGVGLDILELDKTDLAERMSILNAYYLPGGANAGLYDGISPVNSFRVVLNTYFGADLARLDDRSYYSSWSTPTQFVDVTDRLRAAPLATHGPRDERPSQPD